MRGKTYFTAAMALCMAVFLTACGGQDKPNETVPAAGTGTVKQTANLDAQTTAQAFLDAGAFSETLEELDLAVAYRLYALEEYGVAQEDILDSAIYLSAGATAEEVSVLVLKDEDTAALVADALKAHVEAQKEAYQDYLPEEVPKLDDAILTTHGSSVLLVVPAQASEANGVAEHLSDYQAE